MATKINISDNLDDLDKSENLTGLYILTAECLRDVQTVKFGMSMKLEERWAWYLHFFGDVIYEYFYVIKNQKKIDIIYLETEIKNLVFHIRNKKYATEYYLIDSNVLHLRIMDILISYNIDFKFYTSNSFKNLISRRLKPERSIKSDLEEQAVSSLGQINLLRDSATKDILNFDPEDVRDENKNNNKYKNLNIEDKEKIISNLKFHDDNNLSILPHQERVLDKIETYYNENNIGKIIWSCGLGKTIMSLLICKKMKFNKILIGVPGKALQMQFENSIKRVFSIYKIKLFNSSSEINELEKFLNEKTLYPKFIITTYKSCEHLQKLKFDFKIGDEAHHLVSSTKNKEKLGKYIQFHKIYSNKTLFLTATEKVIKTQNKNLKLECESSSSESSGSSSESSVCESIIYSMDDVGYFGNVIDKKPIKWAIENKKITDYNIILIYNTKSELQKIIRDIKITCDVPTSNVPTSNVPTCEANSKAKASEDNLNNFELIISAYLALKTIERYKDLTHILIYTNKIEDAVFVEKMINLLLKHSLFDFSGKLKSGETIFNKTLSSKNSTLQNEKDIEEFRKSPIGIVITVFMFGEGFDCPELNGVLFAGGMVSEIRIIQSSLRPNRLNILFPNKLAYIIIPTCDNDEPETGEKNDKLLIDRVKRFDKVRKILNQIQTIDKIEDKLKILTIKPNATNAEDQPGSADSASSASSPSSANSDYVAKYFKLSQHALITNPELFHNIIFKLKKYANLADFSKYNEYNFRREANKSYNLKSDVEYHLKVKNEDHYISQPAIYFKELWKGWYEFLNTDTSKYIYDFNDWKIRCRELNIQDMNDYSEKAKIHLELPQMPNELYNGFSSLSYEIGKIAGSRR
jgi:superfamily II DNA or RNA helicase